MKNIQLIIKYFLSIAQNDNSCKTTILGFLYFMPYYRNVYRCFNPPRVFFVDGGSVLLLYQWNPSFNLN